MVSMGVGDEGVPVARVYVLRVEADGCLPTLYDYAVIPAYIIFGRRPLSLREALEIFRLITPFQDFGCVSTG